MNQGSGTKSRKRKLETTKAVKVTSSGRNFGDSSSSIAIRDVKDLHASPVTLNCAQNRKCVPCAYKIGCFDVALDTEFTKKVPNQRPEQCPRSTSVEPLNGTLGYRQDMNVLTVGDGDMSFSLALARLLKPYQNSSLLISTSYEDKETLRDTYQNFEKNINELELLGAQLYYKVDATRLKETLPLPNIKKMFHRICWNFPCTAIANGQDGQNDAMEENKVLVRQFMKGARKMLQSNGEIHMAHKTKPPYNQWQLEEVALDSLKTTKLQFLGKVVLDRYLLSPYTPRKALDRKSFPCHDACFYIFGRGKDQKNSTIDNDSSAVPITPSIILLLRNTLMSSALFERSNKYRQRRRH
jgi:25S rRNA (uracil2634-N3)-methyltransferase